MRKLRYLAIVLVVLVAGCRMLGEEKGLVAPDGARVIRAARATKAPVIDGQLDDACWGTAQEVAGFLGYNSDLKAGQQSFAYVCYDDTHLYIGAKGLLPKGVKPKGEMRPHDSNVFQDEVFEIMLDPGATRSDYYQLAINAYGGTFDCSRLLGGGHEDDAWNGEWKGKSYVGDGFFSVELAVPYHNLGITPKVGSTWGINVCREGKTPGELSSIGAGGAFNDAKRFAVLTGVNADFSKYRFKIGPGYTLLEPSAKPPQAILMMPIANMSDRTREVKISIHGTGADGKEGVKTGRARVLRDRSIVLELERLPAEPLVKGRNDTYIIGAKPGTKKIVVSDAKSDTILALSLVKDRALCEALSVEVDDPWNPNIRPEKTRTISLKVTMMLPDAYLRRGMLLVTLTSRETGKPVLQKKVLMPGRSTNILIDTETIPWGAYDAQVLFKTALGRCRISADTQVTVLPGGPHRIRPLNNLVSELMDAGARGLIWDKTIPFMNPRDGWCFFTLSGAAAVRLDSADKPLIACRRGAKATEAMRMLPAGKHTLHVEGDPEVLIVRAVPELIYCQYQANPHISPHGPYDWKFLSKDVLPNCNVIVGGVYPEKMAEWRAQGRKWLTHVSVPGIHSKKGYKDIDADVAYKHWTRSGGYSHPLMDGMVADEFTGGEQEALFVDFARSILRLSQDAKFKGRDFYAWCGGIYGSEAGRVFIKTVHRTGGCHCFEQYLPERRTEAEAGKFILSNLVQLARGWEAGIPGSKRKAVVTLGYMSQPTESLNHHPSANYKVYMDMQFQALANDPVLFGTYGIMEYLSSYCDEENVRWAGRLYRHYGIEGKTERLCKDPYINAHIKNPDFNQGKKDWDIVEAEPGSVSAKDHNGYSWMLGLYPRTRQGDNFLLTKRSAKGPNRFSQQISNLKPGRLYSLKMMTGDYQDLVNEKSRRDMHAVSIELENVDILPGKRNNFQFIFPNCYAHHLGKFDGTSHKYWMNYHWRVFRARDGTARIAVSDWQSDTKPGGPAGQELMFSFIEIQPYLAD